MARLTSEAMDCCRACESLDAHDRTSDPASEARVTIAATRADKLAVRARHADGTVEDIPLRRFGKDVIVIGRSAASADLVLRDRIISRVQCRLIFRNGRVELEDLGSSCGTTVLGHKITRTTLRWGDIVRIGDSELEVVRA